MSSANENMITFKIGPNGDAVFMVPEGRIRASSEFADAAMRGPWQESQERVIALPEFDKKTFGTYLQWLLTGVVHTKAGCADGNKSIEARLYSEILRLPNLSVLGHYLLDTDFRDSINDALIECTADLHRNGSKFPASYGPDFYDKTPDQSPIRKLVVDLVVWDMREFHVLRLKTDRDTMHPDYIMDLLLAVSSRLVSGTPGKSPLDGWDTSCKYHCHGDEKPCYRKKADTYVICSVHDMTAAKLV